MSNSQFPSPSQDAINVLKLLKHRHNVLIVGPPATGKSRLLAEVRHWFVMTARPTFQPSGGPFFPAEIEHLEEWLPSPEKSNRNVYPITFHQNTKYRDLVSGIIPNVTTTGPQFSVVYGPLYNASIHALADDGASLVAIDEINRGPAVAAFGDSITAIESDKRLNPDGTYGPLTSLIRLQNQDGAFRDLAIPHHVYIVAAMNEADTSVEPLDVAFLRRFEPYRLEPNEAVLRAFLSLQPTTEALHADAPTSKDIYEALVQAWAKINLRIELARGGAFRMGHGVFFDRQKTELPTEIVESRKFAAQAWSRLMSHVEEVFFGDTRGIAATIRAGNDGSPYQLVESYFAENPVVKLNGPRPVDPNQIFTILRAVSRGD